MLLELAQWLSKDFRVFNVFGYITLRMVLAAMTALVISFLFGPAVIRWLAEKKIGQAVRDDGPQSHLAKTGTPTMGGALILIAIGVTTLLWGDLSNRYVWVVLLVTLGFGAVGWVDDWRQVVHRNPKGLSARAKFLWQSLIGAAAAIFLATTATLPAARRRTGQWRLRYRTSSPASACSLCSSPTASTRMISSASTAPAPCRLCWRQGHAPCSTC